MTLDFRSTFAEQLEAVPEEFFDADRFVPGVGPADADVVLVGEAPGETEVAEGAPFVGPSGRRLDSILEAVGADRDAVYVTNLVKVRPPENRDPTIAEIDAWKPVLEAELAELDASVVVALGAVASRALLEDDRTVEAMREDYPAESDAGIGPTVIPTYHPAATLYDPSTREGLREDLTTAFEQG